jgi:hypothetical protein
MTIMATSGPVLAPSDRRVVAAHPADDPKLLYHYTDAKGLCGILSSGKLRATDVLYLNDASELDYVFQLLDEVFDGLAKAGRFGETRADEALNMLRLASSTVQESWHNVFLCFVACFCECKNLLSQWRGYGSRIGGYSIGFNRRQIESVSSNRELGPYEFNRVDYNSEQLKAELVAQFQPYVETGQQHGTPLERAHAWHSLVQQHFGPIGYFASHHKHPAFVEEKEWRIVRRIRREGLNDSGFPKFRTGPLGLVPYIDLDVSSDDEPLRALVSEIVIGPTPHPELAERSLKLLLASIGYAEGEVIITPSQVPLRA